MTPRSPSGFGQGSLPSLQVPAGCSGPLGGSWEVPGRSWAHPGPRTLGWWLGRCLLGNQCDTLCWSSTSHPMSWAGLGWPGLAWLSLASVGLACPHIKELELIWANMVPSNVFHSCFHPIAAAGAFFRGMSSQRMTNHAFHPPLC